MQCISQGRKEKKKKAAREPVNIHHVNLLIAFGHALKMQIQSPTSSMHVQWIFHVLKNHEVELGQPERL